MLRQRQHQVDSLVAARDAFEKAATEARQQAAQKEVAASRVAEVEAELERARREHAAALVAERQRAEAASGAPRSKVDSLARMLRVQQEELSEGYRFSASARLVASLEQQRRTSLLAALGAWRLAHSSSQYHELDLEYHELDKRYRKASKESKSMALLLGEYESKARTHPHDSAALKGPRHLSKPPLPQSSTTASRQAGTDAGSRSGSPNASSPGSGSPGPLLSRQLEAAVSARSSSPGRSVSPPSSTLTQQLQDAINSRSRRSTDEHGGGGGTCEHCGLIAESNIVRCAICGVRYHIRCLTSSQAARWKGRQWWCDDHMDTS